MQVSRLHHGVPSALEDNPRRAAHLKADREALKRTPRTHEASDTLRQSFSRPPALHHDGKPPGGFSPGGSSLFPHSHTQAPGEEGLSHSAQSHSPFHAKVSPSYQELKIRHDELQQVQKGLDDNLAGKPGHEKDLDNHLESLQQKYARMGQEHKQQAEQALDRYHRAGTPEERRMYGRQLDAVRQHQKTIGEMNKSLAQVKRGLQGVENDPHRILQKDTAALHAVVEKLQRYHQQATLAKTPQEHQRLGEIYQSLRKEGETASTRLNDLKERRGVASRKADRVQGYFDLDVKINHLKALLQGEQESATGF